MTDATDYAWAEAEDEVLSALTVTLVQPDDDAAIRTLKPRSRYAQAMTFDEALHAAFDITDWAYGAVLVQTDSLDGWAALVEPCGWASADPGRLAQLSHRGTAISVFWNVNANMQFGVARNGLLVRFFDPLLYDESLGALPEEGEFEWGVDHPRASALALLGRLCGVQFGRDWLLDRARTSYIVPL